MNTKRFQCTTIRPSHVNVPTKLVDYLTAYFRERMYFEENDANVERFDITLSTRGGTEMYIHVCLWTTCFNINVDFVLDLAKDTPPVFTRFDMAYVFGRKKPYNPFLKQYPIVLTDEGKQSIADTYGHDVLVTVMQSHCFNWDDLKDWTDIPQDHQVWRLPNLRETVKETLTLTQ